MPLEQVLRALLVLEELGLAGADRVGGMGEDDLGKDMPDMKDDPELKESMEALKKDKKKKDEDVEEEEL